MNQQQMNVYIRKQMSTEKFLELVENYQRAADESHRRKGLSAEAIDAIRGKDTSNDEINELFAAQSFLFVQKHVGLHSKVDAIFWTCAAYRERGAVTDDNLYQVYLLTCWRLYEADNDYRACFK